MVGKKVNIVIVDLAKEEPKDVCFLLLVNYPKG
jgi:hypothetical protein